MDILKKWLEEAAAKKPMEMESFFKTGDTYAKRLGIDKDLSKDDLFWAKKQRKKYLETVWHACMRSITPQGFSDKLAADDCYGSLRSFYSNESSIDKYCPPKWRSAVMDWLIQAISKNEDRWVKSRFEIVDRNGSKYVKSFW